MKHPNFPHEPFEQPFLNFISHLKKLVAFQLFLIVLALFFFIFAFSTALSGQEFAATASLAISIFLFLGFILALAYSKEALQRKALISCQQISAQISSTQEANFEHCAKTLTKYAQNIDLRRFDFFFFKHLPKFLSSSLNHLAHYVSWRYLHAFTEMLFLSAIDKTIAYTKTFPLQVNPHASLANCYVMLASHYMHPLTSFSDIPFSACYMTSNYKEILKSKARGAAKAAVEELSILKTLSPDQLWVHDQLAISYRELGMPKEEIKECEEIIRLCPDDQRAQMRLGTLYFQLGFNAKGLIVYEQLKGVHPLLAAELISYYGSYHPFIEQAERTL